MEFRSERSVCLSTARQQQLLPTLDVCDGGVSLGRRFLRLARCVENTRVMGRGGLFWKVRDVCV